MTGITKPGWLNTQVNVGTIVTVITATIAIISYVKGLETRISEGETYRMTRSAVTDKNFESVFRQLDTLNTIPFRVTRAEAQIEAVDSRVDRLAETIVGALDVIRKDIATLSTKVEVMDEKIDNLAPKKAELPSPLHPG